MSGRRRPEQQIQRALFDHLKWRAVPGCFYFHCPNGGWRTAIEGAILKGMGVTAGIPDIVLIHDGYCFALELKTEVGRLTNTQKETHERLRSAGCHVATAHGLDAALKQLTEWQLLRGARS